jgi:D-aspartate ligase
LQPELGLNTLSNINRTPVVLGGHINGYNIIRELYSEGLRDIGLIDYLPRSIARFSNKITYLGSVDGSKQSLLAKLLYAKEKFGDITVFPTDDVQLKHLCDLEEVIQDFCFIPVNNSCLKKSLNKSYQYDKCSQVGLLAPKTIEITSESQFQQIPKIQFPIIIKPSSRPANLKLLFRNHICNDVDEWNAFIPHLKGKIKEGIAFVVSEFIPGDDTNIFAYTCYRSKNGKILGEWVGKKLTQHPDIGGVYSSASNQAPEEVLIQGRALVDALDCYGVCEPEFKFDPRDEKLKLMEVNLRSMMWHRVGYLSGVSLHKTLLDDSIGKTALAPRQTDEPIHLVYFTHELSNLIARKGYFKNFRYNIFGCKRVYWSVFEKDDVKPFMFGLTLLLKRVIGACLRRLKIR